MAVRDTLDRRGRIRLGSAGLLERDAALEAIDATLDSAAAGTGGALLIEGHAGMGKTRLHEAALDRARARQMRVLRAAGAELEQHVAFGVAGQLLSAALAELSGDDRESLLADAPPAVRSLASTGQEPGALSAGPDMALSHGLFTMLAAAPERRPTLVAIDDLHWSDPASLEFVLYLVHRIEELSFAVVLTRRPGMGAPSHGVLERIAIHPRVTVETLQPLGADSVRTLTRRALGQADGTLVDACREVTGGNPFYLRELLLALGEDRERGSDQLAEHARALAPDAVTRSLRVRVGRLGPAAAALARAVAILGDDVPLRHAAALAGLDINSAAEAADSLAAVQVLLAREPLRFVHPLVRRAIDRDIPASERASRHLEAARMLDADGARAEQVAAQLLLGRAEGDPWVVDQLRGAAVAARAHGSAQSAVRYLERALREPPSGGMRTEVLGELGVAEAALGLPAGIEHLAAAYETAAEPRQRAELALARGRALRAQGDHERAARAYDAGLAGLAADAAGPEANELHDALQTGFVASALLVPALQGKATKRAAALLERAAHAPPSHGRRLLLAQATLHQAWSAAPAATVTDLAERAWDAGRLLERETSDGIAWSLLTIALSFAGELERAVEIASAALEDARRRASPLAFATASFCRSLPRLWQGRVTEGLADLELALGARRYGWREFLRAAAGLYCVSLIETGELDRAERELTDPGAIDPRRDTDEILRLSARGQLRLAKGQGAQALADAVAAGRAVAKTVPPLELVPWRPVAAQAAIALGDHARARELADQELALTERTGAVHARIRALRIAGLSEPDQGGLAELREAVALGERAPMRLETIRALIELGAALRRSNQRAAARPPLQKAADLAKRGGAKALSERARTELAATGARPRRDALLTGPASLTPSERRIAELAASGSSNREIALTLFVTPKTVEYHLRNVYRKLQIRSRDQLAAALAIE
jgi:DNA-binding CsgD family transcriptional regulator/tetratricopeptide (TPR) repeat protein